MLARTVIGFPNDLPTGAAYGYNPATAREEQGMKIQKILPVLAISVFMACNPGTSGKAHIDFDKFVLPGTGYRPWVRWWWPGNDVDPPELQREIDVLADNFFGGAEIQALDAALDPNADESELARRHSVDTPSFFNNLKTAFTRAKARGLTIDLTLGSGWPPGGSQVAVKDSLKALVFSQKTCAGPKTVRFDMKQPDKPEFYQVAAGLGAEGGQMAVFIPEKARLVTVIAAKVTGGKRTSKLLDLADQVVLDPNSLKIITNSVKDGVLNWECPAGNWEIIAFFNIPDGEPVGFDAQPKPGLVMDFFNASRVRRNLDYLLGTRTGLSAFWGRPVRGFFVDSFELKTERFFTEDFLDAFQRLRGYDITRFLPAITVPGADNSIFDGIGTKRLSAFSIGTTDTRIQYDYQKTASDLFIDRFIGTSTAWARERGLKLRIQPYGLNIDVIRAAGMSDIPEAEQLYAGGVDIFTRLVASGAHLYGRNIVSAESLVWPMRDQATTPAVMKIAADKLFCDGINHLVYHGFPYRKTKTYGLIGWHPFCSPFGGSSTYSSRISESSPFWPVMPEVNKYIARCQYLLRQGRPHADILVYYPWFGFPAAFFRLDYWEELFNGRMLKDDKVPGRTLMTDLAKSLFGPPDESGVLGRLRRTGEILAGLHAMGWEWDWLNDDVLMSADSLSGKVLINGNEYKAILVPDSPAMPVKTAQKLAKLAKKGVSVIFAGSLPEKQPGFFDYEHGDALVKEAVAGIANAPIDMKTTDIAKALTKKTTPFVRFSPASPVIHHVTRDLGRGAVLTFFANESPEKVSTDLTFYKTCEAPQWLDAKTGVISVKNNGFSLILGPYESIFLACGLNPAEKTVFSGDERSKQTIKLTGGWQIRYTDPKTGKALTMKMDVLQPLNEVPGLEFVGDSVEYETDTDLHPKAGTNYVLDLGGVRGVASVSVNGKNIGTGVLPPFRLRINAGVLKEGTNSIVVKVLLPLRNYLIGKANSGEPEYAQFGGNSHDTIAEGLLGPVNIKTFEKDKAVLSQ